MAKAEPAVTLRRTSRNTVIIDDRLVPWVVELEVTGRGQETVVLQLHLTQRPGRKVVPISAVSFRRLPMRRLVALAKTAQTTDLLALTAVNEWTKPAPYTVDHLKAVADLYRHTVAQGGSPRQVLADAWSTSEKTIDRWIRRARDEGYLGEARRGRPGEQR